MRCKGVAVAENRARRLGRRCGSCRVFELDYLLLFRKTRIEEIAGAGAAGVACSRSLDSRGRSRPSCSRVTVSNDLKRLL